LELRMSIASGIQKLTGWQRDILRAGVAIVLATVIIGLTMSEAMRRGMHHALAVSPGEEIAVAIALSDTVYGVHLGYVGLASVFNAIQAHWNRGGDGWANLSVLVENFHNRQLLNDGIRAAASLGPQKVGYFTDGSLITTIYDDMGEVDFVKLSFAIFGQNVESMFMMFFVLIGVSAMIFILTFRNNVYALGVLLCTLFALYIMLYLTFFDPTHNPSFFGMRNSSMLGLVPMWYFTFLLIFPRKLSPALIACALVELAILILAWRIRSSVAWVFMFLFLLSAVLGVLRLWPPRAEWDRRQWVGSWLAWGRSWPLLLRDALRWPVVLVLLGLLANGIYNQQSRHLIYSTDDIIPEHGVWWAAILGLYRTNPHIFEPRVKLTSGTPEGWWFLRDYFDRTHLIPWSGSYQMSVDDVPGLLSPWTAGGLKYRLADKAFERIFFEAVSRHPVGTLRAIWLDKLLVFLHQLASAFKNAPGNAWIWLIVAAGIGVFAFVSLLHEKEANGSLGKVILVSAGALSAAALPNLLSIPWLYAMTDTVLLSAGLAGVMLGLGAYALLKCARGRWRDAGASQEGVQ
jgi:hypothetical protein